ncbi:MAG TPA: hypothetical protein VGM87_04260 [Roseomonas sp.]|jgi:hypothetical protein
MAYRGDDYPEYPGSARPALKEDFEALRHACGQLGVTLMHESGGHFFNPASWVINIDTRTPNARGFVSLGHLTDEFLHAWNQRHGRGRNMDRRLAEQHIGWGRTAAVHGTRGLGSNQNICFHKLEALNFVDSKADVPRFIWKIPLATLRAFAYSWAQDS